jgi:hypothetical protein
MVIKLAEETKNCAVSWILLDVEQNVYCWAGEEL